MPNFIPYKSELKFWARRIICVTIIHLLSALPPIHAQNTSSVENDYNYQFGNLTHYRYWTEAREWNLENGEPLLKKVCAEAHSLAGIGSYPEVDWAIVRERTLQFRDPRYVTRRLDVVEYSIVVEGATTPVMDGTTRAEKLKLAGKTWAIIQGRRRECVYYLNLDNATESDRIFSLKEEVCGINNLPTPPDIFQ